MLCLALSATAQTKSRVIEDGGTGPYKAIMTEVKGLEAHTVIAPQDLSKFNAQHPLPILVWGNGACSNSPFEHVKFLSEIASYGYLVLATGYIPMTDEWYRGPMSKSEQQIESIDWAYAQNNDANSPYYQKIDLKNLCVAGMSCGGLQSLFNCADPRISAVMICNSGLFNEQNANQAVGGMPMPPKEKLKELHTPIIYILGGEPDIAYRNGMDDFHRISHVPAIAANLPVGHGGTYSQPHGGEFAIVAKAWLDWQLKGDQQAARMFLGEDCGLKQREGWTIEKNALVDGASQSFLWQDPEKPRAERVENLLSMLTPEEKVGLMMNKSISIDRLGIPSYNWWSEACHGVRQGGYTVYPQPIGMAAAFSAQLVRDVFSQVSDEARANWNRSDHSVKHVGMGETYYPGNPELSFWCPNVNIFRDPRWGRGQETCGEDPYMNAILGVQTVLGMQRGTGAVEGAYYKTHACAKHYAVHSGPEPLRHSMNVEPSNRDLWETYLPAFKALVKKADVREVMCAYQRYEGKPCCTSDRLLIDILRNKWGYDGLVVTDCDAINNFFNRGQHETHKDPLSASVDAVLNGTDLECGKVFMNLTEGLKQGLIKESDLDQHLRHTLTGRFELGMFDPADRLPWANLGSDVISSEEHDALATQAARESMVLLENKQVTDNRSARKAVLPLSKDVKTLAVIGPNADDIELLNGNYGGTPTQAHQHSLLEGIRKAVPGAHIIYNKACELNDDYQTIHHLADFNGGKGVLVEFWNNKELDGEPAKTGYYNELNFSTFGAWGFAEGINNDSLSVRISGRLTAPFTGEMKYTLTTDNGYVLKVNGKIVEEGKPGGRRGFGFGRQVEYKSFPVEQGKDYDVVIEYRRGNGQFAMLRGDICERKLVDFTDLSREVSQADAIIIIGGISARMEGEGGDKKDIELPSVQQRLVKAMHATGRPVIFVNCSGSAIAFGSVEGQYDALLQAWYPGQGGSKALADVLFGDYNPGGKLPVTFYRSNDDLPDFLDYSMRNRTYRYFTGEAQYPFGFGLSYTRFTIGKGKLSAKQMTKDGHVTISVPVKNVGQREGTETVQVYVKALDDPGAPIKALKGFEKLWLKPGEKKTAVITLDGEAFEYYDESIDELSVKPGRYQILYGTSSRNSDLKSFDFTVEAPK